MTCSFKQTIVNIASSKLIRYQGIDSSKLYTNYVKYL